MNITLNRESVFKIYSLIIIVLIFFSHLSEFRGEDILVSRISWTTKNGNDLLGAWSAIFYGSIPNFYLEWWQILIMTQALMAGFGLYLFYKKIVVSVSRRKYVIILFFDYVCINLAVSQTRDGIMISSILLSAGLINYCKNRIIVTLAVLALFFFAFSFRPWLAVAFFPILYLILTQRFKYQKFIILLICSMITIFPFVIENTAKRISGLKSGFPQQTVMIHDLATTLCMSPITSSRINAYETLEQFESYKGSVKYLCNSWKPNTWQSSVTTQDFTDPMRVSLLPPIEVIQENDYSNYEVLRKGWIKTIVSDPKTYIQNHIYFFVQVLIGGESQKIELLTAFSAFFQENSSLRFLNLFYGVFDFGWQLMVALHFLSPILVYLFFFYFYFKKIEGYVSKTSQAFLLTLTLWTTITTIGFVSDNGRYTYLPALILFANWLRTPKFNAKIHDLR
jgi:hypothetical protein